MQIKNRFLFILALLFSFSLLLFSNVALPILVKEGETFINRNSLYLPLKSNIFSIDISPDNTMIISGEYSGKIKIWNINSGKIVKILKGHKQYITVIVISSDGKTIISGSADKSIKVWDITSGKLLKTLKGHKGTITSIVLSSNGQNIISGAEDGRIKIWNRITGQEIKELFIDRFKDSVFSNLKYPIFSLAIGNDNRTIISGSGDGMIKVWDIKTGEKIKEFNVRKIHNSELNSITSLQISANMKTIITGSSKGYIKIRDIRTGQILKNLKGHKNSITSLIFSHDNKKIISASSDKKIKIWNIETGDEIQRLEGHKDGVMSIAISNDDKTILSGSKDMNIKLWDITTGQELKNFQGLINNISSVSINKNGKIIIYGLKNGSIIIWNTKKNPKIQKLNSHTKSISSLILSDDEKIIVSGSKDNNIKIWDVETEKNLKTLKGHNAKVAVLAISKDNKIIVSASRRSIKVWDVKTGKELHQLKGHLGYVNSLVINENLLFSSSQNADVKIWDITTGKELSTLRYFGSISAISNNGKQFVFSSGKDIDVFEIGHPRKRLKGHTGYIHSLILSNNKILSASNDGNIRIWNIENGRLLNNLYTNITSKGKISLSKDEKLIALGVKDGRVLILDSKTGETIGESLSGENGTWITFDYKKKKFFRGDNGTLLYQKDDKNNLALLTPQLPIKDNIVLKTQSKNVRINHGVAFAYKINITNITNKDLYWVKSSYHDKYCTVSEQIFSNIKAGEERNIILNINCNLSNINPKPITHHKIILPFITATNSKFTLPIDISIPSPNIKISEAKILNNGKNISIKIKNNGNKKLNIIDISLSKPFQSNTITLRNLEVNQSETLMYSTSHINLASKDKVLLDIHTPNLIDKSPKKSHKWNREHILIDSNKIAWYMYILWLGGILILFGLIYYSVYYMNPLVLKLAKNPNNLFTLSHKKLNIVEKKLTVINRWNTLLDEFQITQQKFENMLTFYDTSNIESFMQQLEIKRYRKKGVFYELSLDDIGLNVNKLLIYITAENLEQIKNKYLGGEKIFIIASEDYQDEISNFTHKKSNNLIAPTRTELTQLLLIKEPKKLLLTILANCLSLKYLSPYQISGGIKSENNFFGRDEIIREITSKEGLNYLLVGARQLGKSSILKVLERHYKDSSIVECYYISLEFSNIIKELNKVLKQNKEDNLEKLVETIKSRDKKLVFLIDEADKFMEHNNYIEISSVFRKLSQEGEAIFVLAGFWNLYQSVIMNYQSPLKNFGTVIHLGALESEACKKLMIEPMKRIGLVYANHQIINETIKLCGNRANLLAIVCENLLKEQRDGSKIEKKDILRGLKSREIKETLNDWECLNDVQNQEINNINRLIVYLTFNQNYFTLTYISKEIDNLMIDVSLKKIKNSLNQLILAYVLEERDGKYIYRIPLLKKILLEEQELGNIETEVKSISREFKKYYKQQNPL